MRPPRIAARIAAQDCDHCVAVWHETVFVVWRGLPTVAAVTGISHVCRAVLDVAGGAVTYLGVIERTSPAPPEPVRAELAKWSGDVVTQMQAAVLVAEGGGFRNALVRGVGLTLTALIPHRVPFKFSGSVEEGVDILARFIPASVGGPAELALAIVDVRQRWGSEPVPVASSAAGSRRR